MDIVRSLSDPKHVQRFQQVCGLEFQNAGNLCHNGHSHTSNGFVSNGGSAYDDVKLTRNGIKNGFTTNGYKNHNIEKDINANHNGFSTSNNNHIHELKNGFVYNNNNQNSIHNNNIDQNGTTPNGLHNNGSKSAKNYQIKYSLPYYLAMIGAFMGDEVFYLTFYPFVLWNMDSVLGRQTVWVWTLVMYLGQATKDYLKVPRPRSPPVIQLETHHLNEFSLPSTHAMAGTAMPVVMAYLLLLRYEFPVWLAISCVPVWTILTCLSRLYLGVHTILDVLCGIVYAVVIMAVTLPYISEVDIFIQSHPLSPFVVTIICLAAVTVCYPAQGKDVAKGSGVRIVAIYMGFCTGLWMNHQFGFSTMPQTSLPYHIKTPSLNWVIFSLLRFVFGAMLLAGMKLVLQKLTVRYFSYLAKLDKPNKLHPAVETRYIISTYSVVGFCVTCIIPYIFRCIGISRPALSEIY